MYYLLGISLTLAFLLAANIAAAILSAFVWKFLRKRWLSIGVKSAADIAFCLRVLPLGMSAVFVFSFVVPAYVIHEPEASGEEIGYKLAAAAMISLAAVIVAISRIARTWIVTHRLVSNWLQNSSEPRFTAGGVPVYRIRHDFPVVAITGVFRPRVFIADKVADKLTSTELDAAIAHELGHLASRDNLKRTILRVCGDLVILPIGRTIERDWSELSESVADQYAATFGGAGALDLASALIKIARIAPVDARPAMPAAAFLVHEHGLDVTHRVRALVGSTPESPTGLKRLSMTIGLISTLTAVMVMFTPLVDEQLHKTTHDVIEGIVHLRR